MLEAYGAGERGISIRSAHGPGKTAIVAIAANHHQVCRFPQKTIVTAPTKGQLFDGFWAELLKWTKRLPPEVLTLLDITNSRIFLKPAPEESFTSVRLSRAEKPEALQGVHCDDGFVLLIGDEGSGIPDPIYEAASGSMSGSNVTTILISNPVRTAGFFFDTHHKLRRHWRTFHISADVPEADEQAYRSARIIPEFVEEMELRYGRRSNAFRVRVLGEFPATDDDTIIPFELIESARERDVSVNPYAPEVWGLDVARFGSNQNTLIRRKANLIKFPALAWHGYDLMETVGKVKHEWDELPPSYRPTEILVDIIGLGAGVHDRLRELGLPVRGINVGESAALEERYTNLRAELWFRGREWFSRKDCRFEAPPETATPLMLEAWHNLQAQLGMPRYKFTSSGKIAAESKDEMRKRGEDSPDLADGFILTMASDAVTAAFGAQGRRRESVQRPSRRLT